MPLSKGSSNKVVGTNIKDLVAEKVPQKQAALIALDRASKAYSKKQKPKK